MFLNHERICVIVDLKCSANYLVRFYNGDKLMMIVFRQNEAETLARAILPGIANFHAYKAKGV